MTRRPPALRRFSQNFLVDPGVVSRIVEEARVDGRAVLEIGPGHGALTEGLASRARRLRLVEVDRALAWTLAERWREDSHVEVHHGDVLEVGLGGLLEAADAPWTLVSNLPYRITTPVLVAAIRARERLDSATVMVQREVGERLAADPGTRAYGSLTVHVRQWAEVEHLFDVGPDAFRPRPSVTSSVLRLRFLPEPRVPVADPVAFERVVRSAFGQRRKTLRNALIAAGFEPERVEAVPDALGWDARRRGETLDLDEFAALASFLASAAPEAPAA